MRADYDSRADTLEIELRSVTELDGGDDSAHPRAVVHSDHGKPAVVDILYPSLGIEEPIAAVAAAYELDGEALLSAAHAALSSPDRTVTLQVAARSAA